MIYILGDYVPVSFLFVLVLSGVWDGTAAGRRVRRLRRACAGGSGQRPSSPRAVACGGGPDGKG